MSIVSFLGGMQGPQLIIILVIVLVLFGGAKLPELARSIGQASKELKKGMSDDEPDKESNDQSDKSSNDKADKAEQIEAPSDPAQTPDKSDQA